MQTFVTLITSDSYFPGVQVLIKSLRKHSQRPIVVLTGEDVTETTKMRILSFNVEVRTVSNIGAPSSSRSDACWANSQYTKLHIWNMIEYDKVVYVDADCLVCAPIDELFDLDVDFAACPDVFPPDRFNAGVLVLKPCAATFQCLLSLTHTVHSYDGGDTGFLNAVYSDWFASDCSRRLPVRYNAQRTMYWFTRKCPGYWAAVQPIKIIHFSSSPKPWDSNPLLGGTVGELEQLWWDTLLSM